MSISSQLKVDIVESQSLQISLLQILCFDSGHVLTDITLTIQSHLKLQVEIYQNLKSPSPSSVIPVKVYRVN